jgi:hypothetical protein
MEVEVEFEDYDGVWLPYFHPVAPTAGARP